MTATTRLWLKGMAAAAISAFTTAAGGAIVLPAVFNFSHDGLANTAKLIFVPTVGAVLAYLKASPMPVESETVSADTTVSTTKNS
jgi:hypothetical protein